MPELVSTPKILILRAGALSSQQHISTLCNHLARQAEIHLVSLSSESHEVRAEDLSERIHFSKIDWLKGKIPSAILSRLTAALRLRKLLKGSDFDLLYIIDSWTLSFVWLATLGSFRHGKRPVVYHTFDMLEPGINERFYLYLEKKICIGAELVVNTDRIRAQYMKSLYRLKTAPLHVRNTYPRNSLLPQRNEELRQTMLGTNPPADALLLVYPTYAADGRLTLELIKAFSLLPARYRLFTIAADDEYANACRSIIKERHLYDRVVLHAPVSHARIVEFVACADLGAIFHNYLSSFGNYLCNPGRLAMFVALGIPFVAADVPSLEADVYRYGMGVSCNPYSPPEIASAIMRLSEEQPGLTERRAILASLFQKEFNYESCSQALTGALNRILAASKQELQC